MDAKVLWNGNMSFTGSADSGFKVPLDAHRVVGGNDSGFRPLELMAVSLAGCTAMDVISILTKMRQDVSSFEVNVQAERVEDHPKEFEKAVIMYSITGRNIDENSVSRAIELSSVRYCPAQSMLSKAFPMRLVYNIEQMNDGGDVVETITGEVLGDR